MKTHIVKQGECLSSIAHRHGFKSAHLLYEHPDNEAFRKKRPDPAVIFPGDEVKIPDRRPRTLALETGKTHRIVVSLPVVRLRVHLRDLDGAALANHDYVMRFEGCKEKGRTTDK
jgi:hypothetical protein